jgi:hypothetical protein
LRRVFLLVLIVATGLTSACVTGSKSVTKSGSEQNIQPDWYKNARSMQSDSTAYVQFATTLHADSTKAVAIATESAKRHLMIGLDELNESIRTTLVDEQGKDALSSANFILQLRRFTNYESDLKVASATAQKTEQGYQGFAKVQISKMSFQSQMRTFLDRATTNANRDLWMAEY